MPTSLHIPKPLLEAVDKRARALKISRNRFIVQALEREVEQRRGWPPGFFEQLGGVDPAAAIELDTSMKAVRSSRRSKRPLKL